MPTMGSNAWVGIKRLRVARFVGVITLMMPFLHDPLCGQAANRMMGVRAGAITTGVESQVDAFLNTDWRTGLSAGGFVSVDPVSRLTLAAGVFYSQRGFGFRMYDETMGLIPGQARVRSLEVQADVGLRVPWPGQSASVRLFAGPVLGLQLACRVDGWAMGMAFDEPCTEPLVGLHTRTLDPGFSVGGGLDLNLTPFALVLDGRYTHGLLNLNKDARSPNRLASRAWSFTVGLGWPW